MQIVGCEIQAGLNDLRTCKDHVCLRGLRTEVLNTLSTFRVIPRVQQERPWSVLVAGVIPLEIKKQILRFSHQVRQTARTPAPNMRSPDCACRTGSDPCVRPTGSPDTQTDAASPPTRSDPPQCRWLEHSRIRARRPDLARPRAGQSGTQAILRKIVPNAPPRQIGRLTRRQVHRFARHKQKWQRIQPEIYVLFYAILWGRRPRLRQVSRPAC